MIINKAETQSRMCNLILKVTQYLNDGDEDKHRCICVSNDDFFDDLETSAIEAIELAVLEKFVVNNEVE